VAGDLAEIEDLKQIIAVLEGTLDLIDTLDRMVLVDRAGLHLAGKVSMIIQDQIMMAAIIDLQLVISLHRRLHPHRMVRTDCARLTRLTRYWRHLPSNASWN
jgi:hypothetical protein